METFAALAVFTVGVMAATAAILSSSQGVRRMTHTTLATNLASSQLEELLVRPKAQLKPPRFADPLYFDRQGMELPTNTRRSRYMLVWQTTVSEATQYYELVVSVYWNTVGGPPDVLSRDMPGIHKISMRGRIPSKP